MGDLAERVFYPLWDGGLSVGHAVRTIAQCLEESSGLEAATAMLDARFLAGDGRLFEELESRLLAWARWDRRGFVARLADDARERLSRHGSVSHLLEPDLKEGAGGLRDVHAVRWAAAAATDGGDLAALEAAGALRRAERRDLEAAEEYLYRLRSALQIETGRRSDRLYLEQQPPLAEAMGFEDQPGLSAPDALMRATFEHARQVEHVARAVLERLLAEPAPPSGNGVGPEAGPVEVLVAFAALAESGGTMDPADLDRFEATQLPEPIAWSPELRDAFLRILRSGPGGGAALEALDRTRLLARFLPEWAAVRCRPQRDPFHRYPVDVHLLETLREVGVLLTNGMDGDPVARAAGELASEDIDGLLLGSFLHDIGKIGQGHHVPVGTEIAARALDRIGVPERIRSLAVFLVEHHLLLSDTATRRDLQDDDMVMGVAARIRNQERLACLYLLTVADGRATGPHGWTPWRAALVRELVAKVQHVLERGDVGVDAAERLADTEQAVRSLLVRENVADVDRFLSRMPRALLLSVEPERAAAVFPLVAASMGSTEVRTAASTGQRAGTYGLTVVSADRPGLLARIAGSLSVAGLSILTAQVFTTDEEMAVDLFEVEGAFESTVGEDRWRRFRSTLRKAVEERIFLEHHVAEKRRHYRPPRTDIPVTVAVDNDASDFFTVIEVGAPDRIGLLFDITRTLFDLGLDVHLAKVATMGERVVDAFYVRDTLGQRLEDPDRRTEVEQTLIDRLTS